MSQKERRKSSRFDQSMELEPRPFSHSNPIAIDGNRLGKLRLRSASKQETMEELNSPFSQPRRSFCHVKHRSISDDGSLPSSPAYMAATASAKARARSLSTPKQRLRLCETYAGDHSPYNLRLFSWSSFNKRNSISQHISSSFDIIN